MAGYKRLARGHRLHLTPEGITGTKFFAKITGGTEDLPVLGERWNDQYWNVIASEMEQTLIGDKVENELWQITYSNVSTQETAADSNVKDEDLPKNFDWGAEVLNVGVQQDVVWTTSQEAFDVPMFKRVAVGNLNVVKIFPTFRSLTDKLTTYAGRVNNAVFLGVFQPYYVLFKGAKTVEILRTNLASDSTNDMQGNRWKATLNFAVREASWQQVWDKKYKRWDTITDTSTPPATLPFELADLNGIFLV